MVIIRTSSDEAIFLDEFTPKEATEISLKTEKCYFDLSPFGG